MKKTLLTAAVVTTVAGISYQAQAESYEVKSGDSLWTIAKENGTSVAELKSLNKLDSDLIIVGQKLKVENKDFYTVKKGDTLKSIAKHFDVSVKELKAWNNLSSDKLKVGKKLIVSEKGFEKSKKHVKPVTKVNAPIKSLHVDQMSTASYTEETANTESNEPVQVTRSNAPTSNYSEYRTTTASNMSTGSNASTTPVSGDVASIANGMAAGKSYVYGANSGSAVDCSAFAQQVMASMGKSIPRTTYAQMAAGTQVSNPQPGDLVFFNGGSHVGVYIGNGQMVDALNPSEGVKQRAVSYVSGSVTGYYRY
ncbi:C40 family peptidase [Macrococcus sp. DPC7161]|uniref:C40 family peptidase n=1 Tax=Macrococcus sp. DPC7161 TaxID=2507060 RepID=UPI00100B34FF|nr:LysM peptidoglycan-binding domain-containing protein [Macrococcus sp. DPC7161]RXK18041.1 LysM peptidoglycan-binding domain-containing protein [Macrococcus sp. DPC7161]